MTTMQKFNPKKPYGTITGHSWARYEQDGVLYDGEGKTTGDEEPEQEKPLVESRDPLDRDFELEYAREFLKNLLSGGPVTKNAIYKECENNNQNWEKVQQAFAEMNGEKIRSGNWTLWKLGTE